MMPALPDTLVWMWAAALALCVVALGIAGYVHFKRNPAAIAGALESFTLSGEATAAQFPLPPAKWRMLGVTLITVLLTVSIFYLARQQIGVLIYKQVLITQAAVLAYFIDRAAFPYSRPHEFAADIRWRYELRRAALIVGAMLASAWGA